MRIGHIVQLIERLADDQSIMRNSRVRRGLRYAQNGGKDSGKLWQGGKVTVYEGVPDNIYTKYYFSSIEKSIFSLTQHFLLLEYSAHIFQRQARWLGSYS